MDASTALAVQILSVVAAVWVLLVLATLFSNWVMAWADRHPVKKKESADSPVVEQRVKDLYVPEVPRVGLDRSEDDYLTEAPLIQIPVTSSNSARGRVATNA
jgi:hypothetical protein